MNNVHAADCSLMLREAEKVPKPYPVEPLPPQLKLPNGEPNYEAIYRMFPERHEREQAYKDGQWAGAVERDKIYAERNKLVCALSKLWPSHLAQHPASDTAWDPNWRNIVCIHAPVGQLSWHIMDSELHMFRHLSLEQNDWDEHTTEQKYERLAQQEATWLSREK